jgi:hypothetical protein
MCRYQNEGGSAFDWYQNYAGLRTLLRKYVTVTADVLMLGCGNSGKGHEDQIKQFFAEVRPRALTAAFTTMFADHHQQKQMPHALCPSCSTFRRCVWRHLQVIWSREHFLNDYQWKYRAPGRSYTMLGLAVRRCIAKQN